LNIIPFLVLPLVGGYAFSTIWHPSLYHAARESGHRLYLRADFIILNNLAKAFSSNAIASSTRLFMDTL